MVNLTRADIKDLRDSWGLSVNEMAYLTGTASGRTIRRWESGHPIPGAVIQLLFTIQQIEAAYGAQYRRRMVNTLLEHKWES